MNEVKKLYDDDGCIINQFSNNNNKSWCSAKTINPIERRKEYKKLCYNFEYKFSSNIPNCAKKGVCDEDCEYMKKFKE